MSQPTAHRKQKSRARNRTITPVTGVRPRSTGFSPSSPSKLWINRLLALCLVIPFFAAIGIVVFSFFTKLAEAQLTPDACINQYEAWATGRGQMRSMETGLLSAGGLTRVMRVPHKVAADEMPSAYGGKPRYQTFNTAHRVLSWSMRPDQIKKPAQVVAFEERFNVSSERIREELKKLLNEGLLCPDAKPVRWGKFKRLLKARLD